MDTRWDTREEKPPRSLRGATEMNTTKLIAHWTMELAAMSTVAFERPLTLAQ